MAYIYIVLIVCNYIFAAMNKKHNKLLLLLCAFYFVFIFSGNSSSGDIPNYLFLFYNSSNIMQTNPISGFFYSTMSLANDIGLDFYQFKIIVAVLTYMLYYKFFSMFQCNIHYIILFYMFHLFFFDVEQIRNALAVAIYLQGLVPLLRGEGQWKSKYAFFTLLASLIHISFIIYMFFLLFNMTDSKINRIAFKLFIIILCVFTFFNNNRIPFLNYILANFDLLGKVDAYFGNEMRYGFCVPMSLHLVILSTVWHIKRKLFIAGKKNRQIDVIHRLLTLSLFFMPLYFLSITFGRLVRNLLPLVLLAGATINFDMRPNCVLRWQVSLSLVFMILCWCTYDIFMRLNDIVAPIMKYNHFINGGIY